MPRYTYKCIVCNEQIVVQHSVNDKQTDCDLCNSTASLHRVMSKINLYKKPTPAETDVGSVVKEHIEDTREEIENMKEKLKNNWSEND